MIEGLLDSKFYLKKLNKIDKQMTIRKGRDILIRIALLDQLRENQQSKIFLVNPNVLAEDKLFATLDTTVRKVLLTISAIFIV